MLPVDAIIAFDLVCQADCGGDGWDVIDEANLCHSSTATFYAQFKISCKTTEFAFVPVSGGPWTNNS